MKNYTEVELGGQTKLLKFDYNAVCDIEERFGKGIAAIFTQTQIGFNVVRLFYWAGLKWKDQGLAVQRVGVMLQKEIETGQTLDTLIKPIMHALKASKVLGDTKESEDDDEGNVQTETAG